MSDIAGVPDVDQMGNPTGVARVPDPLKAANENPYVSLASEAAPVAPPAPVNPYLEMARGTAATREQATRTNILAAGNASPDTAARALELSAKTGIPAATVERDVAAVEGPANVNEYVAAAQRNSGLGRWLSDDPMNARVAKDDYANLGIVERAWNELRRTFLGQRADLQAIGASVAGQRLADLESVRARADRGEYLPPLERRMLEQGEEAQANAAGALGTSVEKLLASRAEADKIPMRPATRALTQAKTFADAFAAFAQDPLGVIFDLSVQSAPQAAVAIGGTIAGGPAGGIATMGGTSFATEFVSGILDNLEELGVDVHAPDALRDAFTNPDLMATVYRKSAIKAAIVGSFDAATMGIAGKTIAPKAAVRPLTREAFNVPAQLAVQMAGGAGGEAGGSIAAGREVSPGAVVAEAVGEMGSVPGDILAMRHAREGKPVPGVKAVAPEVQRAEAGATAVDRLMETAQATKLATRSPAKLEEFLGTLTADSPHENVFVPVEAVQSYLQSLPAEDAAALATRLGIAEQLPEAAVTGGDIVVPLAKYLAGGSEAHQAWRQDMRVEADGFSIRQATEDAKVRDARLKEATARFEQQLEAGVSEVDPSARVFEDFRSKLTTSGQFTNDIASQYATLMAERYATRAAANPNRFADAWAAYQAAGTGRGVDVQSVVPESVRAYPPDQLDVLLNAVRTGKEAKIAPTAAADVETAARAANPALFAAHDTAQMAHQDAKSALEAAQADIVANVFSEQDTGAAETAVAAQTKALAPLAKTAKETRAAVKKALATQRATIDEGKRSATAREQLRATLDALGIDPKLPNAKIRAALEKAVAKESAGRTLDQPVYHGSPHVFDKFTTDHIGSGEGAQAYGWGLYFAGRKEVGAFYRNALSKEPPKWMVSGKEVSYADALEAARQALKPKWKENEFGSVVANGRMLADIMMSIERGQTISDVRDAYKESPAAQVMIDAVEEATNIKRGGRLYHVEIPNDGAYLLWDKPLLEQPHVHTVAKEILARMRSDGERISAPVANGIEDGTMTGAALYQALPAIEPKAKSEILRQAGVPGIKYLDGSSRGKGDGHHNYVLFDGADAAIRTYEQSPTEPFYSAVARTVWAAKQDKASVAQWLGLLKNAAGVKPEEMQWLGLEPWLKAQSGSVSKGDIAEYIRANSIEVHDVLKSAGNRAMPTLTELRAREPGMFAQLDKAGVVPQILPDGGLGFMSPAHGGDVVDAQEIDDSPEYSDAVSEAATQILSSYEQDNPDATQYGTYTLPGGADYHELLLTLPSIGDNPDYASMPREELGRRYEAAVGYDLAKEDPEISDAELRSMVAEAAGRNGGARYHSNHWEGVANVVAHVRFNERVIDGKRTLLIEEVQSDWHQEGRRKGYQGTETEETKALEQERDRLAGEAADIQIAARDNYRDDADWIKAMSRITEINRQIGDPYSKVPDAPFKTTWPELAMKRMIRYASDHGFEKVAWVPGDVQAARYDLSKQVKAVSYNPDAKRLMLQDHADNWTVASNDMTAAKLPDYVGKDIADRLLKSSQNSHGSHELHGLDLKVGGEGMRGFYDKILPSTVNKLIRKFGAKVGTSETPIAEKPEDPMAQDPFGSVSGGIRVHVFDMTPELDRAARGGFALFQEARGSISFGETAATIHLFADRNLSTVLHEVGHLWAEELGADAAAAGASEAIKADWQTLLDHIGSKDGFITREQHELLARSLETYLMEGNAPSTALQGAFRRFKSWLVQIYRRAAALQAPITPAVREVFDRLIATDEAIQTAREAQALNPIFKDAKSAGMSKAAFDAYTRHTAAVVDDAEAKALAKTMESIRKARTKEMKSEEAKIRDEVAAEVMKDPGQAALHLLTVGTLVKGETPAVLEGAKLDRKAVAATMGDDQALRMLPLRVLKDGGVSPDLVAAAVGVADGRELIERLMKIEADQKAMRDRGDKRSVAKAAIDEGTAARMKAEHGDPLNDGSIEAEAMAAVHSDKQAALLAYDLRILARKAGHTGTITLKDIEGWAQNAIAEMSVYNATQTAKYQRGERLAGQKVERALVKGDFGAAFKAKQDQLVNNALYRESRKASDRVEAAVKLNDRYASAQTIKNMDQGALDQIHQLQEKYDFKKRSGTLLTERTTFAAWAAEQTAAGFEVVEPPRLGDTQAVHYTQMTVSELDGLTDTIKQIAHIGRWKKAMADGAKKREFEAIVDEAVKAAGRLDQRGVSLSRRGKSSLQATMGDIGHAFRSADSALLKLETLFEWLDDDETGRGVFSRVIFRRLADAQHAERDLQEKLNGQLQALYAKVPLEQRKRWTEIVSLPSLISDGRPAQLNRSQLVAMALNLGNESNFDKMARGEKWEPAAIEDVLDKHLSKEEWAFVQDAWDLIETMWPDVAAMERRVNGVAPPKIEAREVRTPYGTLRGGYYPAAYDARESLKGEHIADLSGKGLFDSIYTRATTRSGATRKRVEGFAAKIRLELDVIGSHLNEIAHDITHREAVMDAYKFLSDERVKEAVDLAIGSEYRQQFEPWLKNIANQWAIDKRGVEGVERFAKTARINTTMVGMGFRLSTMFSQVAGFANSMQRLGMRGMSDGMRAFMINPRQQFQFVVGKSGEMRHRANNLERDIIAAQRRNEGKVGVVAEARRFAFSGIGLFDAAVTIPTWIGAYNKGLREKMSDADAVYYADKMVRDTQGAGGAKDLAAVQRGGEMLKLFTMFYSYFNVFYNRQRGLVRDARDIHSTADAMHVLAQSFWLLVVPQLLANLLSGQGPGDDEDWGSWVSRNLLFGLFSGLPWARDVANTASNMVGGKGDFGGAKLSPVQGIADTLFRVTKDAWRTMNGEETSKTGVKAAFTAAGLAAGLPTGQLGASSQYVWDVLVKGSEDPQNAVEWMKGLAFGPEHRK